MNTDFAQQRQHAHGLIELLAPEKLTAVVGLLEILLDPLHVTLQIIWRRTLHAIWRTPAPAAARL